MPGKRRSRGRPKTQPEDTVKVSLMDIAEEIDDPTIFNGVLAYKQLQKDYIDKPKEEKMTLTEFETAMDDFKKQKIYKAPEMVTLSPGSDDQQTPTGNNATAQEQQGDGN